jgi:hypothetical protein
MTTLDGDCDCVCSPPDCPYKADATDHRGRGILAGDFIKPDPALTQRETRVYILEELQRWLTGRICEDAKTVDEDVGTHLEDGTWPAARLRAVLQLLETDNSYILPPVDKMDRMQFVGQWAVGVCSDYLSGYAPGIPAAVLATGFVTEDKLPCGSTIESFWDHSPFAPLREAAPLADGIDEQLTTSTSLFYKILTTNITLPTWVVLGGVAAIVAVIRR